MPKHAEELRNKAVAFARLEGSRAAAERFGVDVRSVQKWSVDAGVPLSVDADRLAALHDAALATLQEEIASGKLKGTQLAVVYGILADKQRLRDRERPPVSVAGAADGTPGDLLMDALVAELEGRHGPGGVDVALSCLLREVGLEEGRDNRAEAPPLALDQLEEAGAMLRALLRDDLAAWAADLDTREAAAWALPGPDLDALLMAADKLLEDIDGTGNTGGLESAGALAGGGRVGGG